MRNRNWLLAGLLLVAVAVKADEPAPQTATAQAEERASLQLDVSGNITIDQQGAVRDYKINTPLAPKVEQLVDSAVRKWRFEPVVRDGKPVIAKTVMYLLLSAKPVEQGYRLAIQKVRFGGDRAAVSHILPGYPYEALRARVGASVLAAVRVDREGNVTDAAAVVSKVTDLRGAERKPGRLNKYFEQAVVGALKKWKYTPADSEGGAPAEVTLIVTTSFSLPDSKGSDPLKNGGWRAADVTNPIPWLPADKQKFDAEGLRDGQSIALDGDIKLQTAVVGTAL